VTLTKQLAPGATLGPQVLISDQVHGIFSSERNASDINRYTTLVGQWDPLRQTLGANLLVAEVQLAGVSLREVPVPDNVTC
jgi:hypothetical protein